ncbi:MAG TPA: FkbM family methyltransferase, partial [Acidisoma sp.]|nr:FkbM family methyltransferase [Acidisoma sp.]
MSDTATAPALDCIGYLFSLKEDGPLGRAGEPLLVPTDHVILPTVFTRGSWQPEEIRFFADRLLAEDRYTLLDIGANVGLFSRQIARAFPQLRRIYCFEPSPLNFAALRFNLESLEPLPALHFINAALDTEDGVKSFYQDRANIGNHSLNKGAMHNVGAY